MALLFWKVAGLNQSLAMEEATTTLSKETIQKIEQIVATVATNKLPASAQILNERRAEHPFQGAPFDALVSKGIPRAWKNLSQHERMLAWGWINPGAEEFVKMSPAEHRKFIKEHPRETRTWGLHLSTQ